MDFQVVFFCGPEGIRIPAAGYIAPLQYAIAVVKSGIVRVKCENIGVGVKM